jgi:hypothetical protein
VRSCHLCELAAIDAMFLFGFGGLFAFFLAPPLLARFILPSIIMLLTMIRLLISAVQLMVDQVLIEELVHSDFYPTPDKDAKI